MTGRETTGGRERTDASRLETLGRALGELVHDLANDIVVLQGWAQLARGEAEAGRPASTELTRVTEVADSVGRMVQDLLAVAEGRPISPEIGFGPVAVTEATLSQRVFELSSLTVRFHCELSADARVRGFASFWARILTNLLSNAARHARGQILIELESSSGSAVLRVQDDGPGLSPGAASQIFEPLWSGAGGVGLGLSSVAWLVDQLGGAVRYIGPGSLGGAAFEVRVPLAESTRGEHPPSAADSLRGTRVLMLDDDEAVRRSLSRLLRRVGAEVQELDPAGESEEALVDALAASEADILMLDLRMGPHGGLALWRQLAARAPGVARRAVFVSGAAPGDMDWEEAASCGQPLLGKPFTLQQLSGTISRLA